MNKKGTLFIIAAPSGAGKTSLVKALIADTPNIDVSISYTTRKPRQDEKDGEAYYFIDDEKFKKLINENFFLEYAKVFNHYYGTPRAWVEKEMETGRNFILEIDWQGARQVSSQLRGCVSIFILPPDYHSLRDRLLNRQGDEPDTIDYRMQAAKEEISHYKEYDFIIINDEFDRALAEIKAVITATNLGSCRQSAFYENFVGKIMAQND